MKVLPKNMVNERDTLCTRLRTTFRILESAVETYNETLAAHWKPVDAAIHAYNAVQADVNEWQETVAGDIQSSIDDHSNRWRESERGQEYIRWQQAYENTDLETVDLEQPETPEIVVSDQADIVEWLPEEIS